MLIKIKIKMWNKQRKEKIKQVEVGGKCSMNISRENMWVNYKDKQSEHAKNVFCRLKNNKENM